MGVSPFLRFTFLFGETSSESSSSLQRMFFLLAELLLDGDRELLASEWYDLYRTVVEDEIMCA